MLGISIPINDLYDVLMLNVFDGIATLFSTSEENVIAFANANEDIVLSKSCPTSFLIFIFSLIKIRN